ncbi:hypothetical protein [Amniculibacterium sp. G2-70]|uniref:hypothetical protein n=1 Tax=Amniculibacterium sp. G2-70 TaxID=2767188 RepID=UPI00165481F0|nr:hypothetical protein [Amniculibacterium sp. G2-70]
MMKNKKLKIFVYLTVLLGFLVSCRTDFINEQTVKNNNSSSLTSRRISLQESSHRQRLSPKLSELKKNLNNENISGKSINLGDSITINTNDIIMMENGTNFHTYTFRINRNNPPPNAPIENLLLTPKSDGSYDGYWITFNLNEQEKLKILNNEKLDLRNKTTVTKIENTGNTSLFSKACIPTYINIAVRCGGEEGHMPGEPCPHIGTNLAAYWTYVVVYDCFDTVSDPISNIYPTEPIQGGSGIFSCPDCPAPEPCVQVPTSPTPSTAITDANGCVVGLPTTPNIDLIGNDECSKAKNGIYKANNILKDPKVKTNMTNELSNKIAEPNEWAVGVGHDANGYHVTAPSAGGVNQGTIPKPIGNYVADGHTHAGGYGDPSGGDFYKMLSLLPANPQFNQRFVFGDYFGTTQIYALVVNDRSLAAAFLSQYSEADNFDSVKHSFKIESEVGIDYFKVKDLYAKGTYINDANEDYTSGAIAMAYILEKFNTGLVLAKTDANGDLKKINVKLGEIVVPNSTIIPKEGIMVTKCP